jgi:hypothetical protein
MRPSSSSGQSSVEYIAVVTLVAIVFAIAGSFTLQGRAIAAATIAQMRRGLCIVEGHDCKDPHPPCPVASHGNSSEYHLDVAFVHLGYGKSAIVERNSNGEVFVTVADHFDAGATTGLGAGLKNGDKIALGGEARAEVLASFGRGKTYKVRSEQQADALLGAIRRGDDDSLPDPVTSYFDGSVSGSIMGNLHGVLDGGESDTLGGRYDKVTGNRTIYLKNTMSLSAGVSSDTGAGVSGEGSNEMRLALTLDRHNKPIDLMAIGSGKLEASVDLPPLLQPVAGHLPTGYGRAWEVEAHLDLTQPGIAHEITSNLLHPQRLARMLIDKSSIQVRGYATNDDSDEMSGQVKAGLVIGAGRIKSTTSKRLIAAIEHTPDGFWVPRYDCLAAAA